MLQYVKECKLKYGRINRVQFVRCVLRGAINSANKQRAVPGKDRQIVKRASQALLELSKEKGCNGPISKEEIRLRAGFKHYGGSGLWPWLKKNGNADVIEEKDAKYSIREEFYAAFVQAVSEVTKQNWSEPLKLDILG